MKKTFWLYGAAALISIAVLFVYPKPQSDLVLPEVISIEDTDETAQETEEIEAATEDVLNPVAIPEIEEENPVETVPELNPVENTNPFNDTFTNPFGN